MKVGKLENKLRLQCAKVRGCAEEGDYNAVSTFWNTQKDRCTVKNHSLVMTIIPFLCFGVALIITKKVITWERVFSKHIFQLVELAEDEQGKDQSLGNGKIQGFLCFKMSSHQGLDLKWHTYDCVNILFSLTELENPITLQHQEQ